MLKICLKALFRYTKIQMLSGKMANKSVSTFRFSVLRFHPVLHPNTYA